MKAVGPDGIPNEFYKEGGEKIIKGLYELFRKIDEEEEVPAEWNKSKVKLTFKHGKKDRKEIKNYRSIAVANTMSNIFGGIIKDKMTYIMEMEEMISEEQNGFRKNRRGTENIYVLKELIEDAVKENKQLYCTFLDIEKAYDTVKRELLWEILERVGFDHHIISIIKSMYRDTTATYQWNGITIENVKSERGLRQGCTLSPFLFTLIMEELTQRIKNTEVGIKVGEGKLSILLFADDVVLLTDNLDDMQKLLEETDKFSEDMEMKFAIDKCKVLMINGNENEIQNNKLKLSGMELEIVEEYKYLGVKLDTKGMDKEKKWVTEKS